MRSYSARCWVPVMAAGALTLLCLLVPQPVLRTRNQSFDTSRVTRGAVVTCPLLSSAAAVPAVAACQALCIADTGCNWFTYNTRRQDCRLSNCSTPATNWVAAILEPSTEFDYSGSANSDALQGGSMWTQIRDDGLRARIAFLVLARATRTSRRRLRLMLSTWAGMIGAEGILVLLDPVWFEHRSNEHVGEHQIEQVATAAAERGLVVRVRRVAEDDLVDNAREGVAAKVLPGLTMLVRDFPNASHYAVVDDDTYIVSHNLHIFLSYYAKAGGSLQAALGATWQGEKAAGGSFLHGGAGIVLPRDAAGKVVEAAQVGNCRHCDQNAGDVRLSCCALASGVALSHEEGFQHASPSDAAKLGACLRSPFPLSFHALHPSRVAELHDAVISAVRYNPRSPVWWSQVINISLCEGN